MFKSKFLPIVVAALLVTLFVPLMGLSAESAADELLKIMPAESIFCLRINNFDYTFNQMDQFLAGISPVPLGLSMMSRAKFAQVLGSPDLKGVNMGGNFAVFATAAPDGIEPVIGVLVPVTDYSQFLSGNPNCGRPDSNGVSKITAVQMSPVLVIQVGSFALVTTEENYSMLVSTAKSASAAGSTGLAGILSETESKQAEKGPVWVYGNVLLASKIFGPVVHAKMEEAKQAFVKAASNGPAAPPQNMRGIANAYIGIFESLMTQTKSIVITIDPTPTALNVSQAISALPGTEMANTLVADTSPQQENNLLTYLEDGAVMNFAVRSASFCHKLNEKFIDIIPLVAGESVSADDMAKLKALSADVISSFGGPMVSSMSIDSTAKPPLSFTYAATIKDADKFNKVIEQAAQMLNTGGILSKFYKSMGMETSFTIKRGIDTYKGVSIDSAQMVLKSTESNSPQGKMIDAMYGPGLNYNWAMVDGLWVCAVGGNTDSAIRRLIDRAKAGETKPYLASETKAALAMLPDASKADFMVTYNYVRLFKMFSGFGPVPVPQLDIPTKNNINIAGKIGDGKLVVDIALPKEHLAEIVMMFQAMQQQISQRPASSAGKSKISGAAKPATEKEIVLPEMTIEPMVGIGKVRFGMPLEKVKEILGQPQSTTGHIYEYFDSGFVILGTVDDRVDAVFCGDMSSPDSSMVTSFKYRTGKGIGMGSVNQDIFIAYGPPSSVYNRASPKNTITLEYESIGAKFTLIDDKVVHMIFRKP